MKETIMALLYEAVDKYGDTHYLTEKTDAGWVGLGYRAVLSDVRSLAAAFMDWGIQGNTAIIAEGRNSWVICEMASFAAGNATVPLSIKLQAEEIPYRINHADVALIVCSKLSLDKVLSVWKQYDHAVKLLYLDSDIESLERIQSETPLKQGATFFTFTDLIARGRELMQAPAWQQKIDASEKAITPQTPATISYTSGTTGNPKGITLSHKNYCADVRNSLAHFHLDDGTRMFVVLPIDHAYAHTIAIYLPLQKQLTLFFVDARGGATGIARNILPNMVETNPHMMLTVPSLTATFMHKIISGVKEKGAFIFGIFERGLKARIFMNGTAWKRPAWYQRILPWFPATLAGLLIFGKIRTLFGKQFSFTVSGGALLEIKQQEFFKALGIIVYQGYGLSEASPVVSTNTPQYHKIGSSGRVLPNVTCRIMDETGHELPAGQKGEICLQGDTIMLGYWKNPEASAHALRDGWLHTGDLGYLDEDGFLYVVGREKALLIMEDGEKYSPEEIEEAIVACSDGRITQCMLYCDHKKYVSALIVLNADEYRKKEATTIETVIQDFDAYRKESLYANKFPRQWLPKTFVILQEPFSEANGQINSTLKMVRRNIVSAYPDKIEYAYTEQGSKPASERNKQTLSSILSL